MMGMGLLNLRHITPATLANKEGEAWKPWDKNTKLSLNGKAPGFRAAPAAAEKQRDP